MYRAESCPCCTSKNWIARWAVIAPFLASYALQQAPFRCRLLECADCSLRFFDVRLTPEEVERLYSGYRGEHYFAERHRQEFWYSRKVNEGIGGDPQEVAERVQRLESFVSRHIDKSEIESVLDYGGDQGQFIPLSLGTKKYVFELSDASPVEGVSRIGSEPELNLRKFDVVLLLGVLEHCSDPASVLLKIKPLLLPGSFLCIGVPYERYRLEFALQSRLYREYLDLLIKSPAALRAVDFYSTVGRVHLGGVPPLGFVKCHEHLNFFNQQSMEALLKRTGFDVIDASRESIVKYPARVESLSVLARQSSS